MSNPNFVNEVFKKFIKAYPKDGPSRYYFSERVVKILKKSSKGLFRKEIDDWHEKEYHFRSRSHYYQSLDLNPEIKVIKVEDLRKNMITSRRGSPIADAKFTQKVYYVREDQLEPLKKY